MNEHMGIFQQKLSASSDKSGHFLKKQRKMSYGSLILFRKRGSS